MDNAASLEVHVTRPIGLKHPSDEVLRTAIQAALEHHGRHSARIGVAIVNDEEMATAHETYLADSGTTDVITFDMSDEQSDDIEGELMICLDVARRESARRGHSVEAELVLYVVHGVLHLLGYDDTTDESFAAIHAMENELLESLGFGRVFDRDGAGDTHQ
jgi:probable rRNA maturation factor